MQDKHARAAIVDLRGAVVDLQAAARARAAADALRPAVVSRPLEDRGYVTEPSRLDPAALALRFCRDGADSLAARMRPVPETFEHGKFVECACGTGNRRRRVFECAGGCGRVFVADGDGVRAARLELEAAAA